MKKLFASLLMLVMLSGVCWAAGNEPIGSLPATPNADAQSYSRIYNFLRDEDSARCAEMAGGNFVVSGGIHSTAGGMTSSAFAVVAYTNLCKRVSQAAATINYSARGCGATDTAWVIASASSANTINNFAREPGTDYFVDCTSSTQPALPSDSVWLMKTTISGSAISAVTDLRPLFVGLCTHFVSRYDSFDAAMTALNTAPALPATLCIDAPVTVSSNVTTLPTLGFVFLYKGSLALSGGITLKMGSSPQIIGPLRQIFSGTGTVVPGSQEPMRPEWWGATGNSTSDDTLPLQAALTAASQQGADPVQGGSVVQLSKGYYRTTATLNVYKFTTLQGISRQVSQILVDHNGDALRSTWPINSNTAVQIYLRDMAFIVIGARVGTNTGAGFVDVGGTFVYLTRVAFGGFVWGVILDQSELVHIDQCDFEMTSNTSKAGVWIVNGPDHTALADPFFTNQITITRSQFNSDSVGVGIQDDGGVAHVFEKNNVNGFLTGIAISGTQGAIVAGNEIEMVINGDPLIIWDRTFYNGNRYVGAVRGFTIRNNYFFCGGSPAVPYCIKILQGYNGSIVENAFNGAATSAIALYAGAVDITVQGNSRVVGSLSTSALLSVDNTGGIGATIIATNRLQQRYIAAVVAGIASGVRTVSPQAVGLATTVEHIEIGDILWCINADGTNGEYVTTTGATPTTFTATFTTSKAANWIVVKGN